MKIAFIGTGVMGKPMALHLADAGYEVHVYNRTYEKAKLLEPKAISHQALNTCVKDADIIFTIVGYPKDVEDTYLEVFRYAKKGAVMVDMTTSSPTLAKRLYEIAIDKGFHMMDAPVTGGDLGAINGTLSIMVGGEKKIFEKVFPLLEKMGKTITYMGEAGNGQHAKLANQTAIAGSIMGIAEALVYAKDKGLKEEDMLKVITGGSASSWQAINNGPKMIVKDYEPGFFVKHYLKDLKLACEEKSGLNLVVLETVTKAFETLLKHGYGEKGTQSIIEYYVQKMI